MRIASREVATLHEYLQSHDEVSDLLITGGDPMVMKSNRLADYLLPITQPEFEHVQTIRIGTQITHVLALPVRDRSGCR